MKYKSVCTGEILPFGTNAFLLQDKMQPNDISRSISTGIY
jgi:hypothetical protein